MEDKYLLSDQLLERARKVTPLGSQTYSKSYRYYCEGISPTFIDHGNGCYLYDVDGNRFIDFVCALGPITVGYSDPRINVAIQDQLEKGIIFSLQSEVEVLLAEKLTHIIPCAEMVRFVKNGADATTAAIRLARAFTSRDMIAMCGYHGMHDWSVGSTVNNKGVPKAVCELTKTFNYNDIASLALMFEKFPNQIAAVILEPIQSNGPQSSFLEAVKNLAHQHGAILIFDEVVSGFRYALGGASELYNVVPDLAAFGKGMGNGLPISAVAGRTEILRLIEEGVFVSTTFGGDALSMAGALAVISILEKPGTYEYIWHLGKMMKNGLTKLVNHYQLGHVISVVGLEPHCGVMFEGIGSLDYLDINSLYSQSMIEHGILSVGINNINLSHTEDHIQEYLNAFEDALKLIFIAIERDDTNGLLKGKKVNPIFKRNIK